MGPLPPLSFFSVSFFKQTCIHRVASVYNISHVCFTASLTYKQGSSSHQLRPFTDLYVPFNERREGGMGQKHVALREGLTYISALHCTLKLKYTISSKEKTSNTKLHERLSESAWGQLKHLLKSAEKL